MLTPIVVNRHRVIECLAISKFLRMASSRSMCPSPRWMIDPKIVGYFDDVQNPRTHCLVARYNRGRCAVGRFYAHGEFRHGSAPLTCSMMLSPMIAAGIVWLARYRAPGPIWPSPPPPPCCEPRSRATLRFSSESSTIWPLLSL